MTALTRSFEPLQAGNAAIPNTSSQGCTAATVPANVAPGNPFSGYALADNCVIYGGSLVGLNSAGNAIPASSSAVRVVGVAGVTVDNTATNHAVGAVVIVPGLGTYRFNYTGTTITKAHIGNLVYASDDNTVTLSSTLGTLAPVGNVVDVDTIGVWVSVLGPTVNLEKSANVTMVRVLDFAGDAAAGTTTAETVVDIVPVAGVISAVKFTPTGALTASDTLYATITVAQGDGAAGARSTLASVTTKTSGSGGTGNWTAFSTVDFGTVTNGTVTAGSCITLTIAKASTGTQIPSGALAIYYNRA